MLQLRHTLYMNAGAVNILVNSEIAFPNQGSVSSGQGQHNRRKFLKKVSLSLSRVFTFLYVSVENHCLLRFPKSLPCRGSKSIN